MHSRDPQIVVLAAGFSKRLGRPKALARVHGISLLDGLMRKLQPLTGKRPAIVVPPRSATKRLARSLGLVCIDNPNRGRGMAGSVRLALTHARFAPAALLLPVDLAGLRSNTLAIMLRRWRGNRRKVIARRLGSRGVVPVLLPHHLFGLARRLQGDTGLGSCLAAMPPDQIILLDMPDAAEDIDTTADLAAARRRFKS